MVLIARFPRLIAFLIILGLWPLSGSAANAQTCHVAAPRYSLQDDIVTWSMTIDERSQLYSRPSLFKRSIWWFEASFSTTIR